IRAPAPDTFRLLFQQPVRPLLAAQQRGLQSLGEPHAVTHLSTDPLGNEQLVSWKVEYAEATLLGTAIRSGDRQIGYLGLRN
ncbi:MAG: hypothetical protein ABI836_10435, partial [Gemmatimonadota bacterium]